MSYGTIMIATLKSPATAQTLLAALRRWEERNVSGYQGSYLLAGDGGDTVVSCVTFESKASYLALANDPTQDDWWTNDMAPLFEGDVKWIDGEWVD